MKHQLRESKTRLKETIVDFPALVNSTVKLSEPTHQAHPADPPSLPELSVVKSPTSLNEEIRPSKSSIARKLGPGAYLGAVSIASSRVFVPVNPE
jgi:hypothetical protein